MAVVRETPWLAHLADIPEDASPPLAMSGPHPRAVGSYGAEFVEWMRKEHRVTLRWWQELAATRQLEHDEDGFLVWREIVETGPRRIGKSVRLRGVATWRIDNQAEHFHEAQLAMLVSKDLAVGKEIHRGAWRWAERNGYSVTRLNGAQEIETGAGNRWLLRAPNAAYGYDVGYGLVDESWGVDPPAITDGIEPALLERESPQLHLTSTAHVKASSLMRRRLTAALRDADVDVLLLMWGAPPGADLADEATWKAASPHWSEDRRALIARKYAAALAGEEEPEFDDPDPVRGWASQYLNVWPLLLSGALGGPFPNWENLVGQVGAPTMLGLSADVGFTRLHVGGSDGSSVGLVVPKKFSEATIRPSQVDLLLTELKRIGLPVAMQEKGPAWHLRPALEELGVKVIPVPFEDYIAAGEDFDKRVIAGTLRQPDDPILNAAIADAHWRIVNRRRVLAHLSHDISALESVLLAVRGPLSDTDDGALVLDGALMA
jgi:hypothetical protein